jgi:hypothetical protein
MPPTRVTSPRNRAQLAAIFLMLQYINRKSIQLLSDVGFTYVSCLFHTHYNISMCPGKMFDVTSVFVPKF